MKSSYVDLSCLHKSFLSSVCHTFPTTVCPNAESKMPFPAHPLRMSPIRFACRRSCGMRVCFACGRQKSFALSILPPPASPTYSPRCVPRFLLPSLCPTEPPLGVEPGTFRWQIRCLPTSLGERHPPTSRWTEGNFVHHARCRSESYNKIFRDQT